MQEAMNKLNQYLENLPDVKGYLILDHQGLVIKKKGNLDAAWVQNKSLESSESSEPSIHVSKISEGIVSIIRDKNYTFAVVKQVQ